MDLKQYKENRKKRIKETKELIRDILKETARENIKEIVSFKEEDSLEKELLRAYFYAFDEHELDNERKNSIRFLEGVFEDEKYKDALDRLYDKSVFSIRDYFKIIELKKNRVKKRRAHTLLTLDRLKDVFDEISYDEETRLKIVSRTTNEDKIRKRFKEIKGLFGVKVFLGRDYLLTTSEDKYRTHTERIRRKIETIKREFSGNVPKAFDIRVNPEFVSYKYFQFDATLRRYKESLEEIVGEEKGARTDEESGVYGSIVSILSSKKVIGKRYLPKQEIKQYVSRKVGGNEKTIEKVIEDMVKKGILVTHKRGCYSLNKSYYVS